MYSSTPVLTIYSTCATVVCLYVHVQTVDKTLETKRRSYVDTIDGGSVAGELRDAPRAGQDAERELRAQGGCVRGCRISG